MRGLIWYIYCSSLQAVSLSLPKRQGVDRASLGESLPKV